MGHKRNRIRTVSDPMKTVFALAFSLLCMIYCTWLFGRGEIREGIAVLTLGAIWAAAFIRLFSWITVDQDGIRLRRFFRKTEFVPWDCLKEVGVVYGDAFYMLRRFRRKFIYFSQREMSEDELFEMMLRWPPAEVAYIPFSPSNCSAVAFFWNRDIRHDPSAESFPA